MADAMEFPETFDEFAISYGFSDTKKMYTNGSRLIPVFRVKQWLEHISSVENKGEWIPVSKRLPDEEHEVYCQLSDGSHAVLYVQDNWGQMEWVDGMMGTGTYDVVAWREKPEPYKK